MRKGSRFLLLFAGLVVAISLYSYRSQTNDSQPDTRSTSISGRNAQGGEAAKPEQSLSSDDAQAPSLTSVATVGASALSLNPQATAQQQATPEEARAQASGTIAVINPSASAEGAAPEFTAPEGDWSDGGPIFERPLHGDEAALRAMANVDELERRNGVSAEEIQAELRRDHDLWLDRSGHLVNICAGLVARGPGQSSTTSPTALSTATDSFKLHSLPGCQRVIYLDFKGHTTSGTPWNSSFSGGASIVSAPFDTDGSPSTFSASELDLIRRIWSRVAEDYAPFMVDVTTEDPGLERIRKTTTSDTAYGVRVVISPTSAWYPNAGGVAYLNSFGISSDVPAFVFTNNLGPNNEKYVAEAISHEAGHTFNLTHMGKTNGTAYYEGQGNWAPIMGVGYYRPITQWTRGEYAGTNNTQDEIASIITHGTPLVTDDYANTTDQAATLTGPSVFAIGLLERAGDADLFRMDLKAGTVALAIGGTSSQSNADIKVELLSSALAVVQTSDDATIINASINATVIAGTYYLRVTSVGSGLAASTGYSTYGSLGEYAIKGTIPVTSTGTAPTAVVTASTLSGAAPLTVNFSGTSSKDASGGALTYTWDLGNSTTSTLSTASATYTVAGTYKAILTVRSANGLTASNNVTITVTQDTSKQFDLQSMVLTSVKQSTGGAKAQAVLTWLDRLGKPVVGAQVYISCSGAVVGTATATTDSTGRVAFITPTVMTASTVTFTATGISEPTGYQFLGTLYPEATSKSVALKP